MKKIIEEDDEYKGFMTQFLFLEKFYLNNQNIRTDIREQINQYFTNLDDFYTKNVKEIVQYKALIAFNYFLFLYKFYKYTQLGNPSFEYVNEFRKCAIRTMETALFMQKFSFRINDSFFNNETKSFYINLLKIHEIDFNRKAVEKIENNDTKLINNYIKIHRDGIFIGTEEERYQYNSIVRMALGYKKVSLASYLRLYEEGVFKVYNTINPKNKGNGQGGGGQFIDLVQLDLYPKVLYDQNRVVFDWKIDDKEKDRYESNYDNDEEYESIDKSRKKASNSDGKKYTIKDDAKKYNDFIDEQQYKLKEKTLNNENTYKKFKINAAIGHLSAKSNMSLGSQYNIPKFELLKKFFETIENKDSFEYQLLVSSIVLGIEPSRLIAMKLKQTTDMQLIHGDTIRVDLTTAYAQVNNYQIYEKTKNVVEFVIPKYIEQFFKDSEEILFLELEKQIEKNKPLIGDDVLVEYNGCKTTKDLHQFMVNNFDEENITNIYNALVEEQQKSLSKYLIKQRNKFKKNIVIRIKNLHTFSLHYFKKFHKNSDANLLFLKNKTANIHTQLAYIRTTKSLSRITQWFDELIEELSIVDISSGKFIPMNSEYSGSNKLISAQEFKNFLKVLMSLKLNNKFASLTLKMIHLRYIFSILLASRKYYFSANLKQYTSREKLLFLHEKAKNIYTSKRVVPITLLGNKYIQYFYELRKEFAIESYSPVILMDEGDIVDFDNSNLLSWFDEHKDEIKNQCIGKEFSLLENFFKDTVFDFGRHIFASKAHTEMALAQDYVDAMLNHFERGTQDQAMYSSFDNQKYFQETRRMMEKIEKEYIPYWSEI